MTIAIPPRMMVKRLAAVISLLFISIGACAEEVSLHTPTGTLYGTLLVPSDRVPAVLIIAGSGPTDRDGNSALRRSGPDSLRLLAEALAQRGIASLRYDKRGVAASVDAEPNEIDARFDTDVDDAVGWITKLRTDSRLTRVAVIGHSIGALVGTLAAERTFVDRLVALAGAGRPAGDVLLSQLNGQLPPDLMSAAQSIIASLNAGKTVDNVPAELDVFFRPSVQPYLISWFRYDPAAEIATLHVPVLIVQGTTDIQVSVDDAMRLAAANSSATLRIIDGMNHVFKDVPLDDAAQNRSYVDPTLPIDRTLVAVIASFLDAQPRQRAVRSH